MLLAVVAGAFVRVRAQPVDPSSFVFDDTGIPTVRVEMSQADFDALFAQGNQYSDVERLAAFEFERVGSVFRVDSVGFRLRGNTSRDAAKKSFKVSFNTFRRGGEFSGLEKLNLNGEHNDPTILRAKIAWDLFNRLGLPAPRANHVSLFINGEYFGLYLNVEHVDEKFLKRHFGNDDGSLCKCLCPADLAFKGTDAEAYRPVDQSRRPYDLKLKDDDLSGYDDLARFITVLNTTDDAIFADELERVFDVNGFLRAHAVTVLLGSWDSYWFLMNNYYLYHDPASGRFEYVPFDFDNVMGIWWDGIFPGLDWTTRNLYEWGHPNEARPLTERILAEPKFRDRYTLYLRRFLQQTTTIVSFPGCRPRRKSFPSAKTWRSLRWAARCRATMHDPRQKMEECGTGMSRTGTSIAICHRVANWIPPISHSSPAIRFAMRLP